MPDTDRVSLRKRAWQIVEVAHKGDTLSQRFDVFILALIVLNVIAAIASTVQSVADHSQPRRRESERIKPHWLRGQS